MRREIKFRAWDEDAEVMIYSDSHKIEDSDYWWETNPFRVGCITGSTGGNQFEPPEPIVTYYENIMQFTGLKDKNGKEIYEGDIVRTHVIVCVNRNELKEVELKGEGFFAIPIYEKTDRYCSVDWFQGVRVSGWRLIGKDRRFQTQLKWSVISNMNIEVIGNIYENPDLLNNQK